MSWVLAGRVRCPSAQRRRGPAAKAGVGRSAGPGYIKRDRPRRGVHRALSVEHEAGHERTARHEDVDLAREAVEMNVAAGRAADDDLAEAVPVRDLGHHLEL